MFTFKLLQLFELLIRVFRVLAEKIGNKTEELALTLTTDIA